MAVGRAVGTGASERLGNLELISKRGRIGGGGDVIAHNRREGGGGAGTCGGVARVIRWQPNEDDRVGRLGPRTRGSHRLGQL